MEFSNFQSNKSIQLLTVLFVWPPVFVSVYYFIIIYSFILYIYILNFFILFFLFFPFSNPLLASLHVSLVALGSSVFGFCICACLGFCGTAFVLYTELLGGVFVGLLSHGALFVTLGSWIDVSFPLFPPFSMHCISPCSPSLTSCWALIPHPHRFRDCVSVY